MLVKLNGLTLNSLSHRGRIRHTAFTLKGLSFFLLPPSPERRTGSLLLSLLTPLLPVRQWAESEPAAPSWCQSTQC